LLEVLSSVPRDKFFGNARLAREVFHSMRRLHAVRVVKLSQSTREQLVKILPDDIQVERQKSPKRRIGFI